jgi:hypothetical protein
MKLEQSNQEIKAAVDALLQNSDNNISQLASVLRPILVQVLSDHMKSIPQPSGFCDTCDGRLGDSKDAIESSAVFKVSAQAKEPGIRSLSSLSSTNTVRKWFKWRKTHKF